MSAHAHPHCITYKPVAKMTASKRSRGDLPKTDAFVTLSLLDGGSFMGDLSRMHAGETGVFRMYNWAFYISHLGRHILWDLGLDGVRTRSSHGSWQSIDDSIAGSKLLHAVGQQIHVGACQSCRTKANYSSAAS